jgi:hypothetical protein
VNAQQSAGGCGVRKETIGDCGPVAVRDGKTTPGSCCNCREDTDASIYPSRYSDCDRV